MNSGQAVLDMTQGPVIVQVPDFGGRFYVYQVVDQRTDAFADIGAMYATTPGFYLLTGPDWNGTVPKGITKVFRSATNVGFLIPRVFREDTDADKQAIQPFSQSDHDLSVEPLHRPNANRLVENPESGRR
jgi:hypothetical protein